MYSDRRQAAIMAIRNNRLFFYEREGVALPLRLKMRLKHRDTLVEARRVILVVGQFVVFFDCFEQIFTEMAVSEMTVSELNYLKYEILRQTAEMAFRRETREQAKTAHNNLHFRIKKSLFLAS